MRNMLLALAAVACFATGAQAQLALNEIYASHAGADDMEFIEIVGTPGTSLQDVFVCVIEGSGTTVNGTLDRAYALRGSVIPADGFILHGTGNSLEPNADVVFADSLEGDTETFYLIQAQDPVGLAALVGTDVRTVQGDNTVTTTVLNTFGAILDSVGVIDAGTTETIYAGAPVDGPDGGIIPAGVIRNGDVPPRRHTQFILGYEAVANTVVKNGSDDVQLNGIHSIGAADNFGFEISSPGATLDNRPFALVATIYATGASPIAGPLVPSMGGTIGLDAWVDVPGTTIALLDGTATQNAFSPRISPFGFDFGPFNSDPALAGTSALLQVIVDAPGFGAFQFATSDARELNFVM